MRLHNSMSSVIVGFHLVSICFLLLFDTVIIGLLWFEFCRVAGDPGFQFATHAQLCWRITIVKWCVSIAHTFVCALLKNHFHYLDGSFHFAIWLWVLNGGRGYVLEPPVSCKISKLIWGSIIRETDVWNSMSVESSLHLKYGCDHSIHMFGYGWKLISTLLE